MEYYSEFLQSILLGSIQGIFEWLPVSSEGVIILLAKNLFSINLDLDSLIRYAVFLHLGTFLAVFIYFKNDIFNLAKSIFKYKSLKIKTKRLAQFYAISTFATTIVGSILYILLEKVGENIILTGRTITFGIGVMLLFTAFLQIKKKKDAYKSIVDLNTVDSILLGTVQGLSILPGLSRSGLTISTLLFRKFNERLSLRLSFLMSLPVVLGANIILNLDYLYFNLGNVTALFFSFLFGVATIHFFLKLAYRIRFGWFVLLFGILMIISAFLYL